jgi:diketogulonate reductase-like aldo/keto reductase
MTYYEEARKKLGSAKVLVVLLRWPCPYDRTSTMEIRRTWRKAVAALNKAMKECCWLEGGPGA